MVKNLKNADLEEAERYFSKHDFASAKNILDHLIKIQPKNSDALHLMGVILGIEKNHEAALTYFKKAIQLNPNNVF
jgi:Tfp pilus assembly protein PilF